MKFDDPESRAERQTEDVRRLGKDEADGRCFVCPDCGAPSYNANDIAERYCGACHTFAGRRQGDPWRLR